MSPGRRSSLKDLKKSMSLESFNGTIAGLDKFLDTQQHASVYDVSRANHRCVNSGIDWGGAGGGRVQKVN